MEFALASTRLAAVLDADVDADADATCREAGDPFAAAATAAAVVVGWRRSCEWDTAAQAIVPTNGVSSKYASFRIANALALTCEPWCE